MSSPLLVFAQEIDKNSFQPAWDEPHLRFNADLIISDAQLPPPDDAGWQPVALPDVWRPSQRWQQGTQGWYRFAVDGPAPEQAYSLYLWRFSMNAKAYFNDELIGSGGSFTEPVTRNWNRPMLWSIPHSAWHEESNRLYIKLAVYPGFGHLMPPAIGPTTLLKPAYEKRYFWQITISQITFIITLLTVILAGAFWLGDRREQAYLIFAASALAWIPYSLNLFVQDPFINARLWWWLVHFSIDCFGVMLAMFGHRLVGQKRPKTEAVFYGFLVLAGLLFAVWDLPTFARYNSLLHLGAAVIVTYSAFWTLRQGIHFRQPEILGFALCMLIIIAFSVHDNLLNARLFPDWWSNRFYMMQFGAPLLFTVMLVHLTRRYANALQETRRANDILEARVRKVSNELSENYNKRQELEQRQAVANERERIYRDLHDDVGARLLSLVYTAENEHQAEIARDALNEIRSIVSSEPHKDAEIEPLLADWRAEVEHRCEEANLCLQWHDNVSAVVLRGEERYQLRRILRELVSNVIKHAGGGILVVTIQSSTNSLTLTVEDDGKGFSNLECDRTRGVIGVRQRAISLGGKAEWDNSKLGGTRCVVTCILSPPVPPKPGMATNTERN